MNVIRTTAITTLLALAACVAPALAYEVDEATITTPGQALQALK